jgi:hypothetical protein
MIWSDRIGDGAKPSVLADLFDDSTTESIGGTTLPTTAVLWKKVSAPREDSPRRKPKPRSALYRTTIPCISHLSVMAATGRGECR